MTDATTTTPDIETTDADAGAPVTGGGPALPDGQKTPEMRAAEHLQLLAPEARDKVLDNMDPAIADRVRRQLESMAERPLGAFSEDVATRRRMLREMEDRIYAQRMASGEQASLHAERAAAMPTAMSGAAPQPPARGGMMGQPPAPQTQTAPSDPLELLRTLHPAAIARAMQGERAEAWAIVLDRLDTNARAALQLYLDGSARTAIDEARARQAELAASAPALLHTIEAAIGRTVVPRAMREHHQLLSTTPLQWTSAAAFA